MLSTPEFSLCSRFKAMTALNFITRTSKSFLYAWLHPCRDTRVPRTAAALDKEITTGC
jgi:hypothetical protein